MKIDTIAQADLGSADPCGTKAEIKKLGLPLLKYATCSLPGKANRGCKHFDDPQHGPCPILALLRERGRPGYENVGTLVLKSPTNWAQDSMPCWRYMDYLHKVSERQMVTEIIGIGGDCFIKRRTTVPIDPKNPRGGAAKLKFVREKVEKALRPNEVFSERLEAMDMAKKIRGRRLNDVMGSLAEGGLDDPRANDDGTEFTDEELDDVASRELMDAEEEAARDGEEQEGGDDLGDIGVVNAPETEEMDLDDLEDGDEDEPDKTP